MESIPILNLILVAILIVLTAFFVASEFAIVKVRKTRIEQLITEGNKKAVAARKVLNNLDGYLSAAQLGITITALGLGWLGEPTVEHILEPVFHQFHISERIASTLSFIIAFSVITFLHVVLGELAPKTIAIQKAEAISLLTAPPLIWFYKIMYPFIWALNGSARLFIRLFGFHSANEHEMAHTEEELRSILSESFKSGEINQAEFKYVNKIFEFDERIAKEIMVPRTEIVGIYKENTFQQNLTSMLREKYTRYPVFDKDKDHIIGMVNMKEVLSAFIDQEEQMETMEPYLRTILHVIETIPIHDLLLKMQHSQIPIAILVDEYGGTSGLVTVEDILEEIVGEIRDEFDIDEKPMIQSTESGYIMDGKVLISEVNELLHLDLYADEIDTIGGYLLSQKIDIKIGQVFNVEHYQFKIIVMEGMQIKTVEVKKDNSRGNETEIQDEKE